MQIEELAAEADRVLAGGAVTPQCKLAQYVPYLCSALRQKNHEIAALRAKLEPSR